MSTSQVRMPSPPQQGPPPARRGTTPGGLRRELPPQASPSPLSCRQDGRTEESRSGESSALGTMHARGDDGDADHGRHSAEAGGTTTGASRGAGRRSTGSPAADASRGVGSGSSSSGLARPGHSAFGPGCDRYKAAESGDPTEHGHPEPEDVALFTRLLISPVISAPAGCGETYV